MTLSKKELQQLGQEFERGVYVRKNTMYFAVLLALVGGLFVGNVVTTVLTPHSAGQQVQVQQPASSPAPADGKLAGEILELEQRTQTNPDDPALWSLLGHKYFDSNQPKKAIAAYTKSLDLQPDQADVLTDLGVMYRRDNQPSKAVSMFDKAIALDGSHEVARFNKGIVLYYDLEQKQAALNTWQELLSLNPSAKAPNGTPLGEMIRNLK